LDDRFRKHRILHCIARPILQSDAISRNAETFEQPRCEAGLSIAVIDQRAAATRKQDAGIGIAPQQLWHDNQPFVVRTIDRTAKHDDAVRRSARRIPRREAIFQRYDQRTTDRRKAEDRQDDDAYECEPPSGPCKARR
jgi:hypothetical protein